MNAATLTELITAVVGLLGVIGFLALLGAIVILSAIGAWTGEPADIAVMTGLIGLGGALIPRRSNPPTDNSQGSN